MTELPPVPPDAMAAAHEATTLPFAEAMSTSPYDLIEMGVRAAAEIIRADERQLNAEAWDAVDEILAAMCALPVASPARNDLWKRLITVAERRAAASAAKPVAEIVAEAVAAERERAVALLRARSAELRQARKYTPANTYLDAAELIGGDQS